MPCSIGRARSPARSVRAIWGGISSSFQAKKQTPTNLPLSGEEHGFPPDKGGLRGVRVLSILACLAAAVQIAHATSAQRRMVGIAAHIFAVMPAAFTFDVGAGCDRI